MKSDLEIVHEKIKPAEGHDGRKFHHFFVLDCNSINCSTHKCFPNRCLRHVLLMIPDILAFHQCSPDT